MFNLTQKQQLVYEHLRKNNTAQSAYDILHELSDHGFRAPSQVYRVLDKLLKFGLIHRVETLNAYVACEHEHDNGNSMMAICDECGAVEELSLEGVSGTIEKFGQQQGFTPRELVVELRGHCSSCD